MVRARLMPLPRNLKDTRKGHKPAYVKKGWAPGRGWEEGRPDARKDWISP